MDTSFVKLPPCGGKTYFLLTQQKDEGKEGFDLTLTDGDKFWKGQLTEEDMDALSSNLKTDFNTFVSETVMALTRRDMGDLDFAYQVKPRAEGVVDVLWKKEIEDVKILMGSVTLHQEKGVAKAVTGVFTDCIDMAAELQQKIRSMAADNQRLAQERHDALKRLDKCVSAKEELEQDLYAKFAAVLNSKKEKIRSLHNRKGGDETMEDDPAPSTSGEAANGGRVQGKASLGKHSHTADQVESADSDQDDEDRNTDDETPPRKRPAPPRRAAHLEADTSLNLGEDDDGDNDKGRGLVKRPARQRGGSKRQTPSKPVLPKVSSKTNASDGGKKTPQRGSLRKSGSGNSDRSVENVDTDDLLNDF